MATRESKAAQDYKAFDQLRNRFGGAKMPQQPRRFEKPRRRDSRFEAPPLKPLVEESVSPAPSAESPSQLYHSYSSQPPGELDRHCKPNGSNPASPFKSKLKFNGAPYNYRPTHQPVTTDLDSVETASQTSQSSAYYSLSPNAGSTSELFEDTSSVESSSEYDYRKRAGFRKSWMRDGFGSPSLDFLMCRANEKGMNRFVPLPQRPSSAGPTGAERGRRMRIPSNEIRVPTQQFNSLEDLTDSGSKSSLWSMDSVGSDAVWSNETCKLGTFVERKIQSPLVARTSHSATPQLTRCSSDTTASEDDITPVSSQDNDHFDENNKTCVVRTRVSLTEISAPRYVEMVTVQRSRDPPPPIQTKLLTQSRWERARQRYLEMKQGRTYSEGSESPRDARETQEEPTETSVVQARAKVFGGTKRGTLRRTQSVLLHSQQAFVGSEAAVCDV